MENDALMLSMIASERSNQFLDIQQGLLDELQEQKSKNLNCELYASKGFGIKVHKIILMNCRKLTKILKSFHCCRGSCPSSSEVVPAIVLPDLSAKQLKTVVQFLYTGILKTQKSDVAVIKSALIDLLGMPDDLSMSQVKTVEDDDRPKYSCVLNCSDEFPAEDLIQHFQDEIRTELEMNETTIKNKGTIKCFVCKENIKHPDSPLTSEKNLSESVQTHYNRHYIRLKKYVYLTTGYKVDDTVLEDETTDSDDFPSVPLFKNEGAAPRSENTGHVEPTDVMSTPSNPVIASVKSVKESSNEIVNKKKKRRKRRTTSSSSSSSSSSSFSDSTKPFVNRKKKRSLKRRRSKDRQTKLHENGLLHQNTTESRSARLKLDSDSSIDSNDILSLPEIANQTEKKRDA